MKDAIAPPLQLPRQHPDFDESMELLCTISPTPHAIRSLVRDFGHKATAPIRALLRDLIDRGFAVRTGRLQNAPLPHPRLSEEGGNYVWVEREGWPEAQELASVYWQQVYGSEAET